ncbi:hypothetical protein ACFV27_44060 [Streptomyces antimycoticus]|uniref:hypothetical protein n=1 Tax=Streptomyces TaxID=1883 RepID=UPI001B31C5C2|nr:MULTISPECIES: hypothetical protein [Streptomyces]AJZ83956.2 hypothetical protein AS97_17600 [Streptomyces sp. AgN23]WJD95324.1 hypothetical protein QR300_04595 [Streptomyces antimycoticus]WTA85893.1 hypothetical protein OG751_41885 [Streptomyces antimycoticus]
MRALRTVGAALTLCAAAWLTAAVPAAADGADSAADTKDGAPTEAGTNFRTATEIKPGQKATAAASTGDYLYWVFPAAAGQIPKVEAELKLPDAASRHGSATWQLDVYDGLRRHQPCASGTPARRAAQQDGSVTVSCTLRQVRSWSERWANDPLQGAYYVRLTVVDLPAEDLGLPIDAEVEASVPDAGGAHADGGDVTPLNPVLRSGTAPGTDAEPSGDTSSDSADDKDGGIPYAVAEPEDDWGSGWWSDRWVWTVIGAALAALAGVGGYTLTRGPRFPGRPPSDA